MSSDTEQTSTQDDHVRQQAVLRFDGSNYVSLPPACVPDGNELTLSMWASGALSSAYQSAVFDASDRDVIPTVNVHLPWSDGNVYFDCGHYCDNRMYKQAPELLFNGDWMHWAFVKNAVTGKMQIIVNGECWHESTGMTQPVACAAQVNLGSYMNGAYCFQGRLAEVRIWSKAQSVESIRRDMYRRLTGREKDLCACWPLDDGEGTDIRDISPAGHHGTINGTALWEEAAVPVEMSDHLEPMTGLENYGFWWHWKQQLTEPAQQSGFRRGRIWM